VSFIYTYTVGKASQLYDFVRQNLVHSQQFWLRPTIKQLHIIQMYTHNIHSQSSFCPPRPVYPCLYIYRGADKSWALQGRKQAWKHVRDTCDFNNIETRAVIKFFSLQGKAPKEIHVILTETLACFLPGWVNDLSAPLYVHNIPSPVIILSTAATVSAPLLIKVKLTL